MALEKLKAIKQKIQDIVANKKLQGVLMDPEEIKLINGYINIKQSGTGQGLKKEELDELKTIYKGLNVIFTNTSIDWDSNKNSLSNEQINVNHENLELIFKIVTLIKELGEKLSDKIISADETILPDDITSLQKKMKEALEKMPQQQLPQSATNQGQGNDVNEYPDDTNKKEYCELEKKAKEKFKEYIENSTIDEVLIGRYENGDLYAIIKLQDNNNENTSIKISEFLNSKFCTENNITGFLILNNNQEKIISGYVDNKVRHYDLSAIARYGIQFNWYVGGKKCSITLSANSDGSIKIVGDEPAVEDLEKHKDVKIQVNGKYLSLADAVESSKLSQPDAVVSSKLSQPVADQALPQEMISLP